MYHDPTVDERFADYLKGKSVAIVGRAEYLRTMEQGALIDSYDVVVRLHKPPPYLENNPHPPWAWNDAFVPPELQPMLGKRVDVLYINVFYPGNQEWIESMLNSFQSAGGKFIANENPSNARDGFPNKRIAELLDGKIHHVTAEEERQLDRAIGKWPLVGTVAVNDIISHDVGTAYITGYPCFLDVRSRHDKPIHEEPEEFDLLVANLRYICLTARERGFKFDSVMDNLFEKYC